MDFEILIDDIYIKLFNQDQLAPVHNKSILSLLNDYEDKNWRLAKFQDYIWDHIALTALSAQERTKLIGKSRSILRQAAQNLRLTDNQNDIGRGSELAEILLYGIMANHYNALSIVPKIFYKQNNRDNVKGADSVHIVVERDNDFSLWFGEAKFYKDINDARLNEIVKSVKNSLNSDKLRKENSIITNINDLESLIEDTTLFQKIKQTLSDSNSMDNIKPKLNIPILLLHECAITAQNQEMDDDYREKIRQFHLSRAKSYFTKQIQLLSTKITKYSSIKFHLILFPVPNKDEIVKKFYQDANQFRGQNNGYI